MSTEITDIQRWIRQYNNPASEKEFENARVNLVKVHKKYGTVDVSIIKQLIN